ncbi:MAG: hypothetical protein LKG24_04415 [Lacticaseibacillus songhuajiangensis]|jgi:hypothetical protein|nr:hypothetical protein [Lacticaseibacillus songhuajiangensis]
MHKDGLGKMLWLRHRWVYALLVVLALGSALYSTTTTIDNYHQSASYARSAATKHKNGKRGAFNEQKYRKIMKEQAVIFTTENAEGTSGTKAIPYNVQSSGAVTSYMMLILAATLGIALVSWDRLGKFERFLYASPFARRRIYWQRFGQGLGALLCATTAFYLLTFGALFTMVPAQYVNITVFGMLQIWVYNLVADSALYAAASWLALIFSNPLVTSVIGIIGFVLLDAFQSAVQIIFAAIKHPTWSRAIEFGGIALRSPGRYWLTGLLVMIIGAVVFAFWGAPIFARSSSENTSHILAFPPMKWPLIVIMAVLGSSYAFDYYDFRTSGILVGAIFRMVLVGLIIGFCMWGLLSFGSIRRRWISRRNAKMKLKA